MVNDMMVSLRSQKKIEVRMEEEEENSWLREVGDLFIEVH